MVENYQNLSKITIVIVENKVAFFSGRGVLLLLLILLVLLLLMLLLMLLSF